MTDERTSHNTRDCHELEASLLRANAENADLKAENRQLTDNLMKLNEKLEDANNEISRLCMVLKHREKGMPPEELHNRLHELLLTASPHH